MSKKAASPLHIGAPVHGLWPVESGDGAEAKIYWVDPNAMRCDCPAGLRRTRCKHLAAVLAFLEEGARAPSR
jgi:hypothetical protein